MHCAHGPPATAGPCAEALATGCLGVWRHLRWHSPVAPKYTSGVSDAGCGAAPEIWRTRRPPRDLEWETDHPPTANHAAAVGSLRRGRSPRLGTRGWQTHVGSGLGQLDQVFGHHKRLHTLGSVILLFPGNNPKRTLSKAVFTSGTFTTATDLKRPRTHKWGDSASPWPTERGRRRRAGTSELTWRVYAACSQ